MYQYLQIPIFWTSVQHFSDIYPIPEGAAAAEGGECVLQLKIKQDTDWWSIISTTFKRDSVRTSMAFYSATVYVYHIGHQKSRDLCFPQSRVVDLIGKWTISISTWKIDILTVGSRVLSLVKVLLVRKCSIILVVANISNFRISAYKVNLQKKKKKIKVKVSCVFSQKRGHWLNKTKQIIIFFVVIL